MFNILNLNREKNVHFLLNPLYTNIITSKTNPIEKQIELLEKPPYKSLYLEIKPEFIEELNGLKKNEQISFEIKLNKLSQISNNDSNAPKAIAKNGTKSKTEEGPIQVKMPNKTVKTEITYKKRVTNDETVKSSITENSKTTNSNSKNDKTVKANKNDNSQNNDKILKNDKTHKNDIIQKNDKTQKNNTTQKNDKTKKMINLLKFIKLTSKVIQKLITIKKK